MKTYQEFIKESTDLYSINKVAMADISSDIKRAFGSGDVDKAQQITITVNGKPVSIAFNTVKKKYYINLGDDIHFTKYKTFSGLTKDKVVSKIKEITK